MSPEKFLSALISARGLPEEVKKIPGAFTSRGVGRHSSGVRSVLPLVANLSSQNQAFFIKSLALYEDTVGGVGSPTSLVGALEAIDDPDRSLFDWVLNNTVSYEYYARGATSYSQIQSGKESDRARAAANLELEAQRAAEGAGRRAKKASGNLINAIRRGDIKAVEGLLRNGASTQTKSDCGLTSTEIADKTDHPEIADLLKGWRDSGI